MGKLTDIDGLIEIDESELGTSINVSQVQAALNEPEKKSINFSGQEENIIEIDEAQLENKPDTPMTSTTTSTPKQEETTTDAYKAFASILKENGALPDIEDKELETIDSPTAIVGVLNKQLNTVNKTWQENYKKNLVQNLIRDGYIRENQMVKDLPAVVSPEAIKSDEKVAINTIRDFYKNKNIPDAQIDSIIKNTIDVEEEALRLLPYMEEMKTEINNKIAQEIKQREEAEITQKQVFEKSLKESVYNFKEFIPGRPLTDVDKETVFKNIVPVLNKINSDLGKYAPIIAYLDKYNLLEGDMSKILSEVNTNRVSDFEKILSSKKRQVSAGADETVVPIRKRTGYNIYG